MNESAGSAAAASGDNGSGGQDSVVNAIPDSWADNDSFKSYYSEDGTFDFDRFGESHQKLVTDSGNQPAAPEKPDDYSFEFPDGYPLDEADFELQRQAAHEAGLTQEQFEAMVKYDVARVSRVADRLAADADVAKKALIQEWGGQQNFDANLKAAADVAVKIFGEEIVQFTDLMNSPMFIKGLHEISTHLSEDFLKTGSGAGATERLTGEGGRPLFVYDKSNMERS